MSQLLDRMVSQSTRRARSANTIYERETLSPIEDSFLQSLSVIFPAFVVKICQIVTESNEIVCEEKVNFSADVIEVFFNLSLLIFQSVLCQFVMSESSVTMTAAAQSSDE